MVGLTSYIQINLFLKYPLLHFGFIRKNLGRVGHLKRKGVTIRNTMKMRSVVRIDGSILIPSSVQKIIPDTNETSRNHSDEEIYTMLKESNMDPNEMTQPLL